MVQPVGRARAEMASAILVVQASDDGAGKAVGRPVSAVAGRVEAVRKKAAARPAKVVRVRPRAYVVVAG